MVAQDLRWSLVVMAGISRRLRRFGVIDEIKGPVGEGACEVK